MSQDVMICVMNSTAVFDDVNAELQSSQSCVKCLDLDTELLKSQNVYNDLLKSQLQAKDTTIYKLKEHIISIRENDKEEKVKHEMDEIETINIELEHSVAKLLSEDARLFKLDIEPLSHRLKNNRDAHEDNLKKTIENTDTIRGLVKRARKQNPSEPLLDSACKFTKHVQELLVYVSQTCPIFTKPSEKLVPVTPMNKVNKVRFLKPLTSSSNIHKQVESSKRYDSNTPVLSSTGLKCSTSICRSQPTGNKKNGRISQKPSSNRKNKVDAQPRKVNKKNRAKEPICDVNVKHTMLNANSQLICVKCNQCMFDANHDVCFLDFLNNVIVRSKSKSAKKSQYYNIWKPTGKVFTKVGHKWKPTRRLFTIVGNSCPLTRITPKKIVHLKETTSNSVETPKPKIKVYSRRPKKKINVPSSSSLVNDRLSILFSGIWTSDAQNI
ncbi:hypothetical protein Tco_1141689 [Tanacetum coccineum]